MVRLAYECDGARVGQDCRWGEDVAVAATVGVGALWTGDSLETAVPAIGGIEGVEQELAVTVEDPEFIMAQA